MTTVNVDQEAKAVVVSDFKLGNELVFNYFDRLPASEREAALTRALHIGVVALMEDRIAAFLSRTENELGTHLESLKWLYARNVEAKQKTTQSGLDAEKRIYQHIEEFVKQCGWEDDLVEMTGNKTGVLKRNKTGDIQITVEGDESKRIVVEVKFDASISLGQFGQSDSLSRPRDTASSQLVEAAANRRAKVAVIVFDSNRIADGLRGQVPAGIKWMPESGLVVIVDDARQDYRNLSIALEMARSMVTSSIELRDQDVLIALLERLSADLDAILETQKLLQQNHDNLKKMAISFRKHALLVNFTKGVVREFIQSGSISREALLAFYRGDEVRQSFAALDKEVAALFPWLLEE
jgi:hypothetical protein